MSFKFVGIGELLWDVFPSGRRLGGAPFNFCYHGRQLGAKSYPVSAVGADAAGAELRKVLASKSVSDQFVSEDSAHPTGTVNVTLDTRGKPAYEICEEVAWDYIPWPTSEGRTRSGLEALAATTDAVCFGSLAQRTDISRTTIHTFLRTMRDDALKIFDVNLRQHFYTKEIIAQSLERCTVLKLSDEELPVLAGLFRIPGTVEDQLNTLRTRFDLQLIAYTRGPDGSLLMTDGATSDHSGCHAHAINSVGAGDAFTAALCMGLLKRKTLSECNDHANRVAAFVCSQDGATPVLPAELTEGKTRGEG